jgi:hypothetical protein
LCRSNTRAGAKKGSAAISKQGDRYLRSLFTAGALAVIRYIVAEYRADENSAAEPLFRDEIVSLFLDDATKKAADFQTALACFGSFYVVFARYDARREFF